MIFKAISQHFSLPGLIIIISALDSGALYFFMKSFMFIDEPGAPDDNKTSHEANAMSNNREVTQITEEKNTRNEPMKVSRSICVSSSSFTFDPMKICYVVIVAKVIRRSKI